MKKPTKSFEIALSAIACAVAAVCLTVGCYVDFLLGAGYILAVFAIMIPLSKQCWQGAVLAALGSVLLAFMFCGFSFLYLAPFLLFFGIHPVVNYFQKKYIAKNWLHALVFLGKAAWFDLVMWFAWHFFLVELFALDEATWYPFVAQYFYYVLFLGGTVVFALYDFAIFGCQRTADALVKRIRR